MSHTEFATQIDTVSAHKLLANAPIQASWEKDENSLFDDEIHPSFYFTELGNHVETFIKGLVEKHGIKKAFVRRLKNTLHELLMNQQKYMENPFFSSLKLGLTPENEAVIIAENSAGWDNFQKACERLEHINSIDSQHNEASDAMLMAELMDADETGGMGLWNLVTQFKCRCGLAYDQELNSLETIVLIQDK